MTEAARELVARRASGRSAVSPRADTANMAKRKGGRTVGRAKRHDKSIKETVTAEAKALAVTVYKDLAADTVKDVGKTLHRFARLGLRALNKIVDGGERLMDQVELVLGDVPEDRLLPAPEAMASKAALEYALLGDGDDVEVLRRMFVNLLASAMDRNTADKSHPAFVAMIAQMTPDEAQLLKSVTRRRYAAVHLFKKDDEGWVQTQTSPGFRTTLGADTDFDGARRQRCISNLDRLGILRIDFAESMVPETDMEALEKAVEEEFPEQSMSGHGGSIAVTPLGEEFLLTCVRDR
jgi:hypothetical protein